MMNFPQSTTRRVTLQAYLSSDHITPATGKTIAVTISKNGAAFANPSAGATNATEIGAGAYYVDLSTTDTGTLGPIITKGTEASIDTIIRHDQVVLATSGGLTALPNAVAGANGGLPTGDASGQVTVGAYASGKVPLQPTVAGRTLDVSAGGEAGVDWANVGSPTTTVNLSGTSISTSQAVASVSGAVGSVTGGVTVTTNNDKTGYALTSGERTSIANEVEAQIIDDTDSEKVLAAITDKIAAVNPSLAGLTISAIASGVRTELTTELGRIDAAVSTRMATAGYTAPDNASIASIKAKTDNLPSDPADASVIADAFTSQNLILDKLDDTLENDSGVYRFTANALEQAPTGGGGGAAPTADEVATAVVGKVLTESYASVGAAPTVAQALLLTLQSQTAFAIVGDKIVVKKLNGNSTAAEYTLDDAVTPTARSRTA